MGPKHQTNTGRHPFAGCGPVTSTCSCFKSIENLVSETINTTSSVMVSRVELLLSLWSMQIWEQRVRWGITATRYCCNLKSGCPSGESDMKDSGGHWEPRQRYVTDSRNNTFICSSVNTQESDKHGWLREAPQLKHRFINASSLFISLFVIKEESWCANYQH